MERLKFSGKPYDAYAAWRIPTYRKIILGRFFLTMAIQMQSVIVGWQVYELTKDPLSLGLIGLAEVIPFLSMALFAGHVADNVVRRRIILITTSTYLVCASLLLTLSYRLTPDAGKSALVLLYSVVAFTGVARAFFYPAQVAYMAQIVPRELYPNSTTWNSTVWHIAAVTGPAIGGLIYGFAGVHTAYMLVVIFASTGLTFFFFTGRVPLPEGRKSESVIRSLSEGIRFVFSKYFGNFV